MLIDINRSYSLLVNFVLLLTQIYIQALTLLVIDGCRL